MNAFDFDYWKTLAETSPAEFEAQRRKVLDDYVATAPQHQQASLNALVSTLCAPQAGTPMERAVHAQNLMCESLGYLQKGLSDLVTAAGHMSPPLSTTLSFTKLTTKKP